MQRAHVSRVDVSAHAPRPPRALTCHFGRLSHVGSRGAFGSRCGAPFGAPFLAPPPKFEFVPLRRALWDRLRLARGRRPRRLCAAEGRQRPHVRAMPLALERAVGRSESGPAAAAEAERETKVGARRRS